MSVLEKKPFIISINPGSTSTKVAVYKLDKELFTQAIHHKIDDLTRFNSAADQYMYRMDFVEKMLYEKKVEIDKIAAVVGRGGLLKPIEGGTYLVNERMIKDLKIGILGDHPSNCGGLIAESLGEKFGAPAYIVDPVVVDELNDLARLSGMPLLQRKSIFHALNQKTIAREAAKKLEIKYSEGNFIVAHLGGGISVGAHHKGRVIDVNNALDGDGPFSPERSGGVPAGDLLKIAFSNEYNHLEMKGLIKGHGGAVAYLGTNDMIYVQDQIDIHGNKDHEFIMKGMAYQISKEIGQCATVLKGKVDAICITGGIAYYNKMIDWITDRVGWIAKVMVFPGEQEMKALVQGALRVVSGEEKAKEYK